MRFCKAGIFLGKGSILSLGCGLRGGAVDISLNMLKCLDWAGKARKVKITECVNNFLLITMELNCKS